MSNARYKQSLEQETAEVINWLSNVSITNAQSLMDEGSNLRQITDNLKKNLIENDKPQLIALLEEASNKAESVLRLSVFEAEWGIFGNTWSPETGYLNHLERMKDFLDKPELNQSEVTAKCWSPIEERHWLHDQLYGFEDSLSKNLITYTDELKKYSNDHYSLNHYYYINKTGMKRLCLLMYWLIDNEISAYPADVMVRLDWLAGKCQVFKQVQTLAKQ